MVSQHNRRPLPFGKLGNCLRDKTVGFVLFDLFGRAWRGIGRIAGFVKRCKALAPPAVQAEIDHNTVKPCPERRDGTPARRICPYPEHRLLHDLLGIIVICGNPPCKRKGHPTMSVHELPERDLVALSHPQHEIFVANAV